MIQTFCATQLSSEIFIHFVTGRGIFPSPKLLAFCKVATGDAFLGVKRPEREAYQLSMSNAGVKNEWRYASSPQNAFMSCIRTNLYLRVLTFFTVSSRKPAFRTLYA
jgi:hypothetical protein